MSLKRVFDIVVALTLIVILSPIMLIVWLWVSIRLESPAIFRQQRPGLNGKPFEMVKFKSMISAVDAKGNTLPDDQRMTKLGTLLRKSSLDELPELWNVLKGEMSLVGPRPLLMRYLPLYSPEQTRRHEVRPGVTGWAQVNGRNAISWEEKFELDVWYVENQSFWLDINILFRTIWQVVRRDDISASEHVTMPEFTGSNSDGTQNA